ncbi:MAG: helix-turn-helix domain-containing protein [Candidatus Bathyarchaeia archaeon]
MSQQDVSDLIQFGLTGLQSRVYLVLLRNGTCRVSQISADSGIVRPEGYRILRELESNGLVRHNTGSPSTYTAVTPKRVLSLLLDVHRQRLGMLERKHDALLQSLVSSRSIADKYESDAHFSVITEARNVVPRIVQMISEAKSDYAAITSKYGLRRYRRDYEITRAIIAAARKKVRVRIISEVDASNMESAVFLSKYVELRRSRGLMFYIDIIDGTEMVLGPAITDEEAIKHQSRQADLWTNNRKFISAMYAMFEKLWKVSRKFGHAPSYLHS